MLCLCDNSTTFSGVAYGSTRLYSGSIRQILSWPGSYETCVDCHEFFSGVASCSLRFSIHRYRKVPTCILYSQASPSEEARVVAWGLKAKNSALFPGMIKYFPFLLSTLILSHDLPDFSPDVNGSSYFCPRNHCGAELPIQGYHLYLMESKQWTLSLISYNASTNTQRSKSLKK